VGVLRIGKKWGIEWYGPDGKRKRKLKGIGPSYQDAVKAYRDTKARLDKGEAPLFATSKKKLAEVAEKYWEVCRGTWAPKEAMRVRSILDQHLLPFFGAEYVESEDHSSGHWTGGMGIARIKQLHVEEYIAHRQQDGASPATINKEVMRLRHLCNKAIAWGEISRNPCQGIRRLKEPPERVAYLDGDERTRLLAAAEAYNPTLRDIVAFAMLTGARLSELLALTWGNVDLGQRIITFRKTKSGKVRHVPMNPDLHGLLVRMALARAGDDPTAPLFPPEWNGPRVANAFHRITNGEKRVDGSWRHEGVKPGFRFHDLRHDFASWLTMGNVSMRGVQTLLGHSDLRMTERYAHLHERVLTAAVEVLPSVAVNGNGHGTSGALPVAVVSSDSLMPGD
jgi:integrase